MLIKKTTHFKLYIKQVTRFLCVSYCRYEFAFYTQHIRTSTGDAVYTDTYKYMLSQSLPAYQVKFNMLPLYCLDLSHPAELL